MGNSVKKIPWRKVYTFFKSPWVNNEPSKAKENVNKCHSKKALQRAKIRKKCDIKVWLWTLFGGRGIDVDEEKIMWIDNILIICNFIELFSNFFSLIWDIKKVAAYTYTRKGLLNSAFFFSFFFSLSQAYQNVLGVLKKCAPFFLAISELPPSYFIFAEPYVPWIWSYFQIIKIQRKFK